MNIKWLLLTIFRQICFCIGDLPSLKIGCFRDNFPKSRDFPKEIIDVANITNKLCARVCSNLGYLYSATQWSSSCYCGNTYGQYGFSQNCYLPCIGNTSDICGGHNANSVYKTNIVLHKQYLGCFKDKGMQPDLYSVIFERVTMQIDMCVYYCSARGFPFAALQKGVRCFCAFRYATYGIASTDKCFVACKGNHSQTCGGIESNSVYGTNNSLMVEKVKLVKTDSTWLTLAVVQQENSKFSPKDYEVDFLLSKNREPFVWQKANFTINADQKIINVTGLQPKEKYEIRIKKTVEDNAAQFVGSSLKAMTCSSLYQVVQVTKVSNCTNHKKELTLLSGCLNIEWSVKNAIFTNSTFLLHYQHIQSLSCDPILRRERTQEDAFAYDKVTKVSGVQHKLKNLRFHACYRLLLSYDDKCGKASIQCTDTSHPKVSVSNISLLNDEKKKRSLLKWSDPSCDLMTGPIERYVILISKNSSFDIKEKLECYFPCNQLELKYFIVGFYYVKIRYMDHLQRSSPYSGMQKIYIAIEPFKVDYTILWMMILSLIALFIVGILYNKFKNAKICFTMAKKGSKQISFFSASAHEPKQKKSSYKPYKDMAASTHFNNQVYFHYVDISQKSTSSALTMNHSSILASINCESVESFYWKRPCERISISEDVLGEGQFGKVYKCRIEMAQSVMTAAVKVLKKSQIHHQSFHKELKIMAKIGHHDNVVNLLGACKRDLHLYVFLEYLENGDLRSYLRKNRTLDENGFLISKSIAYYQLVKFAYEICEGMIYLGSHRIIHRDLAARNIMIGDKMEAKIGDFGLAREENIYVKNTPGRLPWRWMAIESLTSRIYTSKSDVWSFGILMWEIITLGGTPYWQIDIKDHNDLKRALLDQNYRMPKPKNCDEKMYNIMTLSWNVDPNSRLNFEEIKVKLESVLAYYEGISLDWNQNTSNDEYYEEVDDSICDSISCAENYSKSYTL